VLFTVSCSNINIKTADRSKPESDQKDSVDTTEIVTPKAPVVYNIAVIIGPGGAKTIAASAILKLLDSEDLNIKYVSGLGWGALPAAIYANNLKPNELEWQFYKLKQKPLYATNFIGTKKDYLEPKKVKSYTEQIFGNKKIQDFKLAFACPVKKVGDNKTTIKLSDSAVDGLMMCLDHPPLFKRADNQTGAALSYGPIAEHFESKDINFIIYIDSLNGLAESDLTKSKLSSLDQAYWQRLLNLNKHYSEYSDFSFTVDTKNYNLFSFDQSSQLIQAGDAAAKYQIKALITKLKQ